MTRFVLALLCAALALSIFPALSLAQDNASTVRAVPRQQEVGSDADTFDVDVLVEDVSNLGAFQFVLVADPAVATVESVAKGEFLASSGREVYCPEPTIEGGSIRFTCVTLGQTPEQGASGTGVLATVTFQTRGSGRSDLELSLFKLNEPPGTSIPATSVNGEVRVKAGGGGVNVAIVAAGGAAALLVLAGGAFVAMRHRSRFAAPAPSAGEPVLSQGGAAAKDNRRDG
jgi:hypothetical protein